MFRPIVAEAASWTGSANSAAGAMVPAAGAKVETVDNEAPDGETPPMMVRPEPLVTAVWRDWAEPSCQGSTPASIDAGPVGLPLVALTSLEAWAGVEDGVAPPVHVAKTMPAMRRTANEATVPAR
jgi:hypothetical protein